MPKINPYRCPQTVSQQTGLAADVRDWRHAIGPLLGMAAVSGAARQYLLEAISFAGLLAGGLLAVVGTAVGRVIALEAGARALTLITAGIFTTAVAMGWIRDAGSERTLWAFACMCAGLLAGAAHPARKESPDVPVQLVEPGAALVEDESDLRS